MGNGLRWVWLLFVLKSIRVIYYYYYSCIGLFIYIFIASEASFLVSSMARIFYYIMFQAVHRAINVLNVSKYPPNVILHSANINARCANVTGSMNWHNTQSWSPM